MNELPNSVAPKPSLGWLLLLYSLPQKRSTDRVTFWRKLRKFGAVQMKPSGYLLPDDPAHYERFQWVSQQVHASGGEASVVHVSAIEGLTNDSVKALFNDARGEDFRQLGDELRQFLKEHRKKSDDLTRVEKLRRRFLEIREIDFFDSPDSQDARLLLERAEHLHSPKEKAKASSPVLDHRKYRNRTWVTRPRPEIDRVSSAWLIRNFIDPGASFVFENAPSSFPEAIPYDMFEGEFTHQGDFCTFEILVARFGILDKAVRKIAEMIHDADLEDGKFQRVEAFGVERLLKGWAKLGLPDSEILKQGFSCFDALYAELRK